MHADYMYTKSIARKNVTLHNLHQPLKITNIITFHFLSLKNKNTVIYNMENHNGLLVVVSWIKENFSHMPTFY